MLTSLESLLALAFARFPGHQNALSSPLSHPSLSGFSEYLEDLVARIDARQRTDYSIDFYDKIDTHDSPSSESSVAR